MASTVFVDTVTHVPAAWANDVNKLVYDVFQGAQTYIQARAALQFGTMAEQEADNVQIAGGDINGTPIGWAEPSTAKFLEAYSYSPISDPKHLVTKEYVDALIVPASATTVITTAPLSGNGTVGNPITLVSANLASPSSGARVLMKNTSNTYEAVPISSVVTLSATLPLSGTGSIATPLTLVSSDVSVPTVGSRLLLKMTTGAYETVDTSTFVGSTMPGANNELLYNNGGTLGALPGTGSIGQVLTSNGVGAPPAWVMPTTQFVGVPASATAPGTTGDFAADSSFIYVCIATDTWVRASASTW